MSFHKREFAEMCQGTDPEKVREHEERARYHQMMAKFHKCSEKDQRIFMAVFEELTDG